MFDEITKSYFTNNAIPSSYQSILIETFYANKGFIKLESGIVVWASRCHATGPWF